MINSTTTVPTSPMDGRRFWKRFHPSQQTKSATALAVWIIVYIAIAGILICVASLAISSFAQSHRILDTASSTRKHRGEDDHSDDSDEEQKRDTNPDKSYDTHTETSTTYVERKHSEIANEIGARSRQSKKDRELYSQNPTCEASIEGSSSSVNDRMDSVKLESMAADTKMSKDEVSPDDARKMAMMRANTKCANQNRHRHDKGQPHSALLRFWVCLCGCCFATARWSSSLNECLLSCCISLLYFLLQKCCRRREQSLRVRDNPARCRRRGSRDELDEIDHHAFYVDRPTEMPRHAPNQFHAERGVPGNYWCMRLTPNQLHPVKLTSAATVTQPEPISSPRVVRRVCDPALDYAYCGHQSPIAQSSSPIIVGEPTNISYSHEQLRGPSMNNPINARRSLNQDFQWGIRHHPRFYQAQAFPYGPPRRDEHPPFWVCSPHAPPYRQEFSFIYPQSRKE